jgi:hypothetical protein
LEFNSETTLFYLENETLMSKFLSPPSLQPQLPLIPFSFSDTHILSVSLHFSLSRALYVFSYYNLQEYLV